MALMIHVLFLVMAGVAASSPIYSIPLAYVALSPIPENIYNQVQDTKSGEYAFGYSGGPVAREEARTADGVTRGAYSYVDAHGIVQYYRYVADADGFRVVGTNIPTDEASSQRSLQQEQPVEKLAEKSAEESAEKLAEKSAEESTEKSAEESTEKSAEASSRKKRSIFIKNLYAQRAAPLALTGVTLPTATSSQSRVQIHNNLKAEIHTPVEVYPIESVAVPAIPLAAKTIEPVFPATIPVAVATSVPTATSSQSRFQIHKSLKTEISVAEIPAEHKSSEAPAGEIPAELKSSEALTAEIPAENKSSEASTAEIPAENKSSEASTAEIPAENRSSEALPVASVPIATSSQSRYQIHNSLKTQIHEPIATIPVAVSPVEIPALPIGIKTIESPGISLISSVATATSNQRRFQVHNSAKLELDPLEKQPEYKVVDLKPVIPLSHENSFSLPLIARNPVGVGLGVVASPLVAYNTYGTTLVAEA